MEVVSIYNYMYDGSLNHIAVARNCENAINYLIDKYISAPDFCMYDENHLSSPLQVSLDEIRSWDIPHFNEFFKNRFFLEKEKLL